MLERVPEVGEQVAEQLVRTIRALRALELRKAPSVLRLSYVADTEEASLVQRRMDAVKRQVTEAWDAAKSYRLTIEPEIFWRRGAPIKRPKAPMREGR